MFLNAKTNFQVKYHEFAAPFRISNLLELQVKVCIAAKTIGMDTNVLRRHKEKNQKLIALILWKLNRLCSKTQRNIFVTGSMKSLVVKRTSEGSNVGDVLNDVAVNIDSAQECALVQELVVIVKQDWCLVHRWETKRRNVDLKKKSWLSILIL